MEAVAPDILPLPHPLAPMNDPEIPMQGGTDPLLLAVPVCTVALIIVGVFDAEYYMSLFGT